METKTPRTEQMRPPKKQTTEEPKLTLELAIETLSEEPNPPSKYERYAVLLDKAREYTNDGGIVIQEMPERLMDRLRDNFFAIGSHKLNPRLEDKTANWWIFYDAETENRIISVLIERGCIYAAWHRKHNRAYVTAWIGEFWCWIRRCKRLVETTEAAAEVAETVEAETATST